MTTKKGLSLHIGVNVLDPASYPIEPPDDRWPDGWDGKLDGCHNDAEAMEKIARANGFQTTLLLSEEATADRVKAEVKKAASALEAGDIFFLSFAGHGGQVPDVSKDEGVDSWGEVDGWDETWCLFDRHFIDDEQQVMYTDFAAGVRVLVVSDSCHSGTVNRSAEDEDEKDETAPRVRCMTRETAHACYIPRKDEYDDLQRNLPKVTETDVKAYVLLLAACEESQTAGDGSPNGKFTGAVLRTLESWRTAGKRGSYSDLHAAVVEELKKSYSAQKERFERGERKREPRIQSPILESSLAKDAAFCGQVPFTI